MSYAKFANPEQSSLSYLSPMRGMGVKRSISRNHREMQWNIGDSARVLMAARFELHS
jgi:hypothetical protein